MSFIQAILVSALYYYSAVEFPYCLYSIICRPVMGGMITGLILGDMVTGLLVGAAVQLIFLAPSGFGGVVPTDRPAAGIISAAAVITTGISVEAGVALSVPAALLFAQLHTVRRIVASVWVHMADRYALTGNTRGIVLAGTLYPTLFKIPLFWAPMCLMLFYGTGAVGSIVESLPQWLLAGLDVTGQLLPALGFAMTIRMIGRRELMPFFLAGFFLMQYTGMSTMALVLVALFLAYLYMIFTRDKENEVSASGMFKSMSEAVDASKKRILTKRDVTKVWLRWYAAAEMSNSFERLQSLAFCISFTSALKKLYGDDPEELSAALTRHLQFFNTEGNLGAIIHGIALSMEEQRAMGEPITGEAIVGLKTGLMGPLAGIGDTIIWATISTIILVAILPAASQGQAWAPIVMTLGFGGLIAFIGWAMTHVGYRLGTKAATTLLSSGVLNKYITFFAVLGLFMMGGMTSGFVVVQTPLVIMDISVQYGVLDAIVPGILTLVTVWSTYEYLRKGKGNTMLKATMALFVIGMIFGALGILGTPLPIG
ncbi:PTS system mannose/fructose/sorbose family transporter subunit IID [Eubacteriales bacterium OttesenSCG-928-N14]|nr:PTS system mannose/fructose/sorbose family transporter subunit IID [Eubacteriales bacterium OttesenSCG-928-N14]